MGRLGFLAAVLAAALLTPGTALAADALITLGPGNTLNPSGNATIDPGDTVSWRWSEDKSHHIQSLPSSLEPWDSGERKAGPDFTHTFPTSGSFSYQCNLHPVDMKGTITVTGTPPPPNAAPTAALSASTTAPASGASVTFNAGSSSDSDGTIANYSWDLDGNGFFEINGGATSTLTRSFTGPASRTVSVLVTDNGGLTDTASVTLTVAAPPAQQTQQEPAATTQQSTPDPVVTADPPAVVTQPATVPAALAASAATTPKPAVPSVTAPARQRLKRQRGVKVRVTCPGACRLVLTGTVKVGARTLRLTRVSRSLGAGSAATLTLKVADTRALRRARGKAKASVDVASTAGGQSATKSITVNLTS